MEIKWR